MQKVAPNCEICRSQETYIWAQSVVLSRSFEINERDHHTLSGMDYDPTNYNRGFSMLPIFDYVNHNNHLVPSGHVLPVAAHESPDPYPHYTMGT